MSRLPLASLLLVFLAASTSVSASSNVVDLTSETFEHQTQASTGQTTGKWFVKFYAPWCGHCKRLAPIWDELADAIKTAEDEADNLQDFVVAKVDCTQHKDVCQRFGITGYPTLKLIANGQVYAYKGERNLEALKTFLGSGDFGEGSPVPAPPSWLDQNKAFKELREDFDHIVSYRKNAAALLIAIGTIFGFLLTIVLQMLRVGPVPTTAEPAPKATAKKED